MGERPYQGDTIGPRHDERSLTDSSGKPSLGLYRGERVGFALRPIASDATSK